MPSYDHIYGGDGSNSVYTLLVTGDRDWTDFELVYVAVKEVYLWCVENERELHVVHGWAEGADMAAGHAARRLQVPCHSYPAPWNRVGRGAGPQRNSLMKSRHEIDEALVVHDDLASSKGTKDMHDKLKKAGVEIEYVRH